MNAQITQVVGGVAVLACTMVLAMTGKIDGPTAMTAITTASVAFFGAQALTHGATAVSEALKLGRKQ